MSNNRPYTFSGSYIQEKELELLYRIDLKVGDFFSQRGLGTDVTRAFIGTQECLVEGFSKEDGGITDYVDECHKLNRKAVLAETDYGTDNGRQLVLTDAIDFAVKEDIFRSGGGNSDSWYIVMLTPSAYKEVYEKLKADNRLGAQALDIKKDKLKALSKNYELINRYGNTSWSLHIDAHETAESVFWTYGIHGSKLPKCGTHGVRRRKNFKRALFGNDSRTATLGLEQAIVTLEVIPQFEELARNTWLQSQIEEFFTIKNKMLDRSVIYRILRSLGL